MNLDTIWQLHRRFLTGTAIALFVFLIGLAMIGNTAGKDLKRYNLTAGKHKRTLNTPAYSRAQVGDLRARLSEMEQRTDALANESLPPLRQKFIPAAGQSPTQHYIELTGTLRSELVTESLLNNVDIDDSLGLPAQSPTQPQMIARILRGLDVVDRVVNLAVRTGAIAVEDIQIASRIPKKRRAGAPSKLDMTPVTMEIVFADVSPKTFLTAVMEASDGLGPLGLIRMDLMPQDKRKKLRRVILEFAAGALPVETAEEEML